MESTPRGIVLIINNKDFGQNHKERTGTEYDCNELKDLFGNLSFQVLERENLTAMEMKKELKAFTQNSQLRDVDCLVLAVLSHGNSDKIICGIDSEGIDIYEHVFPLFSAKNCRMMRGKPKMFIFNACRGGKNGESFDTFRPQISRTTIPEKDQLQRDGPNIEPSDSQVLDMQDLLLCFSTFPGYSSYRDPNQGSWFIQEFVSVFKEQCSTEHVMDMLTEINRRVSQKKHSDQAAEMCVQMPFPSSSLTKKWYINPH